MFSIDHTMPVIKNEAYSIYSLFTGSHKIIPLHYCLWRKYFVNFIYVIYLDVSFHCKKKKDI